VDEIRKRREREGTKESGAGEEETIETGGARREEKREEKEIQKMIKDAEMLDKARMLGEKEGCKSREEECCRTQKTN